MTRGAAAGLDFATQCSVISMEPEKCSTERPYPATTADTDSFRTRMSTLPFDSTRLQAPPPANPESPAASAKKKKKARAAWIAFAGRIVAQVIGAFATVFLGIYAVDKYTDRRVEPQPLLGAAAAPVRAVHPATGRATLAVLPLDNFSGDPAHNPFADALTDVLIAKLAEADDVRVISRTSSMRFKGHNQTLPEIAQQLGVDFIIEGSIVRADDGLRVTAQLIDAHLDEHVWARSYDRSVRNVLAVQAEVAATIAEEVREMLLSRATTPPAHD